MTPKASSKKSKKSKAVKSMTKSTSKSKTKSTSKSKTKSTTKTVSSTPEPVSEPTVTTTSSSGDIRQGTIAKFMRKRTQLVGFEMGLNKHTQYVVEFLDNALDAIESLWWKRKKNPKLTPELDPQLIEHLKQNVKAQNTVQRGKDKNQQTLVSPKKEKDDLKSQMRRIREFLEPFSPLIKAEEPFVVIKLEEVVFPDLTFNEDRSDYRVYRFTIFDSGVGMVKSDLEKYGIYLASSKSEKLRQTRGSQGFGAPSAFSDAQNTTGKPIVALSRRFTEKMGIFTEFFTTTENDKDYVIPPTEVRVPFKHGTYVQLYYLNIQYKRGYADVYARMSALMNAHITIIFIDPYGEVAIYPRGVGEFPKEPKYAQAHPASVNIGEFQDLLRETPYKTLFAFLRKAFTRISANMADKIIQETNIELKKERLPLISRRTKPDELSKRQVEKLYRVFASQDYLAPPTDTVVPVGEEVLEEIIQKTYEPEFVAAVTRKPTSGKGLSFAVEAAIAYGGKIQNATSATQVLWRFVNRTPKLRDNSDCATWKATAMVNWKNYKIDTFDNGIPKGPVMLFIHVCGAYAHVMFKGQSKQALAEDDVLIKEVKLALEQIGRTLRSYITRKQHATRKAKRAGILAMYADLFAKSIVNIAKTDPKMKKYDAEALAQKIRDAIEGFEDESKSESKSSSQSGAIISGTSEEKSTVSEAAEGE